MPVKIYSVEMIVKKEKLEIPGVPGEIKTQTNFFLFQNRSRAERFMRLCSIFFKAQTTLAYPELKEDIYPYEIVMTNFSKRITLTLKTTKLYRQPGNTHPYPVCEGAGWMDIEIAL